jgi:hypothetical protein
LIRWKTARGEGHDILHAELVVLLVRLATGAGA